MTFNILSDADSSDLILSTVGSFLEDYVYLSDSYYH